VQQQLAVYDGDQPDDRRIRFRVGINIGDVIAEGTDVHGDSVNLAARLQAACPPGGICVARGVRDHVHGRLDLNFEQLGQLAFKNIARPVEAFVLRLDPSAPPPLPVRRRRPQALMLAALAALLLAVGGGAAWWLHRDGPSQVAEAARAGEHSVPASAPPLPATGIMPPDVGLSWAPRMSLVVLPFQNLSGDPRDDSLAEGITDDLTSDLTYIPNTLVIARESAYAYKGKAQDVRQIGAAFGVRYVLEGSVRRIETTLRVNAQLTSAETGAHLWSDRFDQKISELAAGQEQVVARMREGLGWSLIEIENARSLRERPTNPDSFDLFLRPCFRTRAELPWLGSNSPRDAGGGR
jgi:adenylate cyclase